MLSTIISCSGKLESAAISSPFLRLKARNHDQIYLPAADKVIGDIFYDEHQVSIHYSSELLLEEYIIINSLIAQMKEEFQGEVDDSSSFLGYLPIGESAFIMTNWKEWIDYIQLSMKNCQY